MTKTEILDAINLLLVSKWPDRTVYVDVCPVDFNRPSFWLTVEKYDLTDGNRFLIRHDLQIRLTLYLFLMLLQNLLQSFSVFTEHGIAFVSRLFHGVHGKMLQLFFCRHRVPPSFFLLQFDS